jgi:photosystem II stability/assembly factor-like uncharacterized protein
MNDGGIFKSTDAGATWQAANAGITSDIYDVTALVIDPLTPRTLYAATYGSGVFKSTDAGASWEFADAGLPSSLVDYIITLAIDPVTPRTLHAGTEGRGIFKSTDAGATWQAANAGLSASYVYTVALDPVTPSTLYAGTLGGGVFKSTDTGATWEAANAGMIATNITALAIDPLTPRTLYAGTLGGIVFKSTDASATWQTANAGLIAGDVTALAIDPLTPSTLYAESDGTVIFKSTDAGDTWEASSVSSNLSNALAIDPLTPSTVYAGGFASFCKSRDAGVTWDCLQDIGYLWAWFFVLAVDPITPQVIYAGGNYNSGHGYPIGAVVFKTTDAGATWRAANIGNADYVSGLVIDPHNTRTLYAGTWGDGVYKSSDAGMTWQAANAGLPSNGYVTDLAIDPLSPSTLYASASNLSVSNAGIVLGPPAVFKSTDAGATWAALTAELSDAWVNTLAIDPLTASTVYAGTNRGVFAIQQVAVCVGDCRGTHTVAINDLITLVNIALGTAQPGACSDGGRPIGGAIDIAVIMEAVNNALHGCGD